jgi:CheY-like chemotaxis protein
MALNVVSRVSIAVILVVDDDVSIRNSLLRLLTARGFRVLAAGAPDALRIAREAIPDIILMDLHMPEASGIDLAHRIKSSSELAHVPVIAISAALPSPDSSLSMFDHFLSKPCIAAQLLAAIDATLKRGG